MTQAFSSLRINPDRMLDAFNQLASIGATGDGGVNRTTFSEAHLAARKWFREHIERKADWNFVRMGQGITPHFLPCTDPSMRLRSFPWLALGLCSPKAGASMAPWV
jgi:hypothetical protein